MITYLQSIKDTKTQRCDFATWNELVNSPQTAEYIKQYRKTKNIDFKQRLPAVNFHGYDPKVLKGLGGSRKQADLLPTGLFMLDIDHVANPKLYWALLQQKMPKEELESRLALAHVTPSGEGLRIVMKGESSIMDDQKSLAALLEVKHDVCTKDLSRWSFVPTVRDILYINPEILFAAPPDLPTGGGDNPNEKEQNPYADYYSKRVETKKTIPAKGNILPPSVGSSPLLVEGLGEVSEEVLGYPSTYHSIPYKKIVEALIQYHGGTPEIGERHARIITLATDLRFITDSNVDWLMQIVPDFGKPHHEKKDAVTWAVQHHTLQKTKALSAVLNWIEKGIALKPTREEEDALFAEKEEARKQALASIPQIPEKLPRLVELLTSKVMPFQRPAVASMVFPALAVHVGEATFISTENKEYELSLMGVLVGKQSVGKGCIDAPIKEIIFDIEEEDERAREEEKAWAESQQNKAANDQGTSRPKKPIRILNSDVTPAALLQRLYSAQHDGDRKDLRCFTKVEEIEELYNMSPVGGRQQIAQLIKKTWDVGKIGSERFSANSANFTTMLRWNWVASCTADKARAFFGKCLTDGTLSRVDFATIIAPDEDFEFIYGFYDEAFQDALQPYIDRLKAFKCETSARGRRIPFRLSQLDDLEKKANDYIKSHAKEMPDDTWVSYAWRTKFIAMKKILLLYIANGGQWEDCFEDFFFWSLDYSLWVKMNLYYEKAREGFEQEEIFSNVSIKSPLDLVGQTFSKDEIQRIMKKHGFKTEISIYLHNLKARGRIERISKTDYKKLTN